MKTNYLLIALFALIGVGKAQTRVSLLEEFTGETCLPCAAYNPALDALLAKPVNASKVIAIKWQTPIPNTPSNPQSLYQTNKAELDWRYLGQGSGGYGYQHQISPTSIVTDGIMNAPTDRIDGRNQWEFGATSNHPFHLHDSVIGAASAVSTPFSINMTTAWDGTFDNCVVTVTVSSSSAFTSNGNLMFRLCLVERYIEFTSPPGTNGEKTFHDVVRKSYPTTMSGNVVTGMGTSLPGSWSPNQQQTLTINCAVPSYILDKSQMAFVGFVQDDGDKKIYQASRTAQPAFPNDARAGEIDIPSILCSGAVQPTINIINNGTNAITAFTLTPILDGTPLTNVTWSGNLAPANFTNVVLSSIPVTAGTHTLAYTIINVSGGDLVTSNNKMSAIFTSASSYFPAPLSEGFEGTAYPPTNWMVIDKDGGNAFFHYTSSGAYGTSLRSLGYQLYSSFKGEQDEILLPPVDLLGTIESKLTFDYAYTGKPGSNDSLFVFVSADCGNTWTKVYKNGGTSMQTAPYNGNAAFDPLPAHWKPDSVALDAYITNTQLLVKFQVRSDQGSGLYLDNINLKPGTGNPPTSVAQLSNSDLRFNIYPNPANSSIVITINSTAGKPARLKLVNAIGQVYINTEVKFMTGNNTVHLDCSSFQSGVYFLTFDSEGNSGTKKLIISK